MELNKIIDVFIPTLQYCSIIISFIDPMLFHIYIILYENNEYALIQQNKMFTEEIRFKTAKELSDKVKTYIEDYKVKTIEIEGSTGPTTFIYKL